jgi:alcohol dehydrogenase (NADP+)
MSSTAHTLTTFRFDPKQQAFYEKAVARELGLHEVLIKTTHASLCYTDVHAKNKGIPLGHEGVGIIERIGPAVTTLDVGQRVGWGWLHSVGDQLSIPSLAVLIFC